MTLRVLFLTCHLPYPPVSGGRRREFELLRRIAGRADFAIDVCAVTKTFAADVEQADALSPVVDSVHVFAAAPPPDEGFGRVPPQIARHTSTDAAQWLAERCAQGRPDIVHVEGFYLLHLLPRFPPPPVVLVEQNIEHLLWSQRACVTSDPNERQRFRAAAELTRRAETAAWLQADLCAAVTSQDARTIAEATRNDVLVIPDGVGLPACTDQLILQKPVVVFAGNFAYEPTDDAAHYLLDRLIPRIQRSVPGATFWLVGNEPSADLRQKAASTPRVIVTGRVPSLAPYVRAADVVLCPLRIGGGIKLKVLEALGLGSAVVTTPVGAQGLERGVAVGALTVAGDAAGLADATVCLLVDPKRRARQRVAARRFACTLPSWDESAERLGDLYQRATEAAHARL